MSTLKSIVRRTWVRWLLVSMAVFAALIVIASFSLTKYIEDHSEAWTGRKIKLSAVWFNPFNCSLSLHKVQLFERKSDSVFVSFDRLYVNFSPWSYVFDDEVRFTEVSLRSPRVYMQMNRDESFNYSDLLKRFGSSSTQPADRKTAPTHYVIEEVNIESGAFQFVQEAFHSGIAAKDIQFGTAEFAWNQPVVNYHLRLAIVSGGRLSSNGSFNQDSLSYAMTLKIDSLALGFLLPFVDKVMYVGDVRGNINTDLRLAGTARIPLTQINGLFSLDDFYLGDTLRKPVTALHLLSLDFGEVKPVDGIYNIEHARITKPFLKFEITPTGNNLLRLSSFAADSAAVTPSDTLTRQAVQRVDPYLNFFRLINQYMIEWGREYAINHYAIDSLRISDGTFEFSDFTLKQPFHFLTENLSLTAYEITNATDSIVVAMNSILNHSGKFDAGVHLSTKNLGDMNLHYVIDSLKITDFSPYSEYYVAHPFWDGLVSFESTTKVSNHYLNSKNRLYITQLEVGDKVESVEAIKLPLKLAVSLLKDVDGNIDLALPLKGDVNDPKFRVMPVVWQVLKNLIVKAAASPYKLVARAVDAKEDDVRDIKYDYMQSDIRKRQNKTINLLARILNQKKTLSVNLVHTSNTEWETVQYALYNARLGYYSQTKNKTVLNFDDSLAADGISASDTAFLKYVEEKTAKLIAASNIETLAIEIAGGRPAIAKALNEATIARKRILSEALIGKGIEANRFTIIDAPKDVAARHRDRPRFDIQFSGESSTPGGTTGAATKAPPAAVGSPSSGQR